MGSSNCYNSYSKMIHLLLVLVLIIASVPVDAQEDVQLSSNEVAKIRRLVESADESKAMLLSVPPARPPQFASVRAYTSRAEDGVSVRQAEVLHYRYQDGMTVRTVVDVDREKIIKTETLEAYPPPLAPEETSRAVTLAKEQLEPVKQLYSSGEAGIEVSFLAVVVADRNHSQFRHRVVVIHFAKKGSKTISAEVDLTTNTATLRSR